MSKYVAVDDVYKALAALDWQDLYLPTHFKEIFDEIQTVPKDWYDEQDVRNAYTDGFSEGIHRGYEDAVHNYSKILTEMRERWIPVTERLPEDGDWVLGIGSKNVYYVCEYRGMIHFVYYGDSPWFSSEGRAVNVTHWMPLPEPPKEEDECR